MDKLLKVDADSLQQIILDLALVRAQMEPPLPNQDLTENSLASAVPGSRWFVTIDEGAPTLMRVCLLHPGIGWVWIGLAHTQAAAMADAMQKLVPIVQQFQ